MVNPVYVNPIFTVALVATAQFKFDVETFTATAETPLSTATLYCTANVKYAHHDGKYIVALDFTSGSEHVLSGHALAGFDTENDARAFLQPFAELHSGRA